MAAGRLLAASAGALAVLLMCLSPASADGAVHELNSGDFDETVAEGIWLVKFYAPWCGHCKHLAPIFEAAAERTKGQVNFAKVDATVESGLKNRYEVEGYPTLKVFKDGEVHDYTGKRTEDGFVTYASRITGPAVHKVHNAKAMRDMMSSPLVNVAFVYYHTKSDDDFQTLKTFNNYADTVKTDFVFCETTNKELLEVHNGRQTPFVAKMEKGEEPVYLEADQIADSDVLAQFVKDNQFRVLSTDEDFGGLARSGRLVVAAVIDPKGRSTRPFMKAIKSLARPSKTTLPKDVFDRYFFMELNGVEWAEFMEQFNVTPKQLPRVVVFDKPNKSFYEDPEIDEIDEIETFLVDVAEGRVSAQREDFWGAPMRWWKKAVAWSPYSFIGGGVFLAMLVYACFFGPGDEEEEASSRSKFE